jgi:gamma-glutamyl phosphate reductase
VILSSLRAAAWKYATLAFAVLAVAAVVWCLFLRADAASADLRAATAEARADDLALQVQDLKQARERDAVAQSATDTARASGEDRATAITERIARTEVKYRDRIVEVPAVCPAPDPELLRELAEGSARVSATEGRLRGLRRPEGQAAE